MRVIFVGMHNKPETLPLDSSTKTGKIIDEIIKNLDVECIKTNLCDINYLPRKDEIKNLVKEWKEKYDPAEKDLIILLGNWVQKNFKENIGQELTFLCQRHPASIFSNEKKQKYIDNAIKSIKKLV